MQGLGGQLGGTEIRSAAEAARIAYSDHSLSNPESFCLSWHEAFQNGKRCLSMDQWPQWQLSNAFELCQGHAAICAATASSGKFIEGIEGLCSDQAACFPF